MQAFGRRNCWITREQAEQAFAEQPMTREAILQMIKAGTRIHLEPGVKSAIALLTKDGDWLMCIPKGHTDEEKEEAIYHELVHLHLMWVFDTVNINDDNKGGYHDLVIKEGKRVAVLRPFTFEQLVELIPTYVISYKSD